MSRRSRAGRRASASPARAVVEGEHADPPRRPRRAPEPRPSCGRPHGDPHAELGVHGRRAVLRAWRPDAAGSRRPARRRGSLESVTAPGCSRPAARRRRRLPARGHVRRRRRSTSTTRTASGRRSATSTCTSSARAATSACGRCSAPTRASTRACAGTAFAVWAPAARAVRVVGDFNGWDGRVHPMRALGGVGRVGAVRARRRRRRPLQVRGRRRRRPRCALKADPMRRSRPSCRRATERRSSRVAPTSGATTSWMRRAGRGRPSCTQPLSVYEVPPRLVAARARGGRPSADLPASWPTSSPTTSPTSASPTSSCCRWPSTPSAARGATRSPATTRRPSRFGDPDDFRCFVDRLHQRGHRRDRRLGAGPLPAGRLRAGPLRRHRALRARRPPPGRAPRLGHARLQLRPQRGAQLPRRQRPLLARGVPRRRPARRRRRLDALPRLLARGRRVGAQRATAGGRTSRPSPSSRR